VVVVLNSVPRLQFNTTTKLLRPISTQEKFPRTENFPKISLLKVGKFIFNGKFVSANHILQNILSGEMFLETGLYPDPTLEPSTLAHKQRHINLSISTIVLSLAATQPCRTLDTSSVNDFVFSSGECIGRGLHRGVHSCWRWSTGVQGGCKKLNKILLLNV
jgi:hypothetical protein